MTDLIINGTAVTHSSLGVRRYFEAVLAHLEWPGRVIINPPAPCARFVRINELFQRGRPDAVYWSPAHRGPLFAHNHIVTVHDCINIKYVYANDWRLKMLKSNFYMLMRNASTVIAISDATKNSILKNFEISSDKIVVIPGPTDLTLSNNENNLNEDKKEYEEYILMITNQLYHKNTTRAVKAIVSSTAIARGINLRVVGSLSQEGRAICADANLKFEEHRGIDDNLLQTWIRRSKFLFAPSLDEGLNLPVADAIRSGTNVLCSDIPVHREFYSGSAAFVDPFDVAAMRLAIDWALQNSEQWFPNSKRPQFGIAAVANAYRELFRRAL
jgi:glycosyltransferase involved in cell wall biosynthesis